MATRLVIMTIVVAALASGCSSDDQDDAGTPPGSISPTVTSPDPSGPDPTGPAPPTSASADDELADESITDTTTATTSTTTSAPPTLPEVGVPGLDSDLVVCRAWSRFAGSFQVVAVAASFGDDPIDVARLEVAAAPVVADAVDEMVAEWPDELADEAELVADGLLGPYARRSARALDALVAAGADDDDLVELADAWLAVLEVRDPTEVLPTLELDAELDALVTTAAVDFESQVVPIPLDPSLVTDVSVPRSEEFLIETCPDRGTLAGTEVDG